MKETCVSFRNLKFSILQLNIFGIKIHNTCIPFLSKLWQLQLSTLWTQTRKFETYHDQIHFFSLKIRRYFDLRSFFKKGFWKIFHQYHPNSHFIGRIWRHRLLSENQSYCWKDSAMSIFSSKIWQERASLCWIFCNCLTTFCNPKRLSLRTFPFQKTCSKRRSKVVKCQTKCRKNCSGNNIPCSPTRKCKGKSKVREYI